MCGIFALLDHRRSPAEARTLALAQARLLRHRGPDWSGVRADARFALAHERLAIVDPCSGEQPLTNASESTWLTVNGEIYNHLELRSELHDVDFLTGSDCEVILPLIERHGRHAVEHLRGMFAFVWVDTHNGDFLVARDHMGIVPLYYGRDDHGTLYVASEMKALLSVCRSFKVFPPGHTLARGDDHPQPFYAPRWTDHAEVVDAEAAAVDPAALRQALEASVRRHLMSDVPYGVLLSGGLDSSVIAALAASMAARRVETDDQDDAWWPRLHTFAIGLEGSPDLAASQVVADSLGTVHHAFTYTLAEGLDALRDVIWHLETFDVTTIRASTPMLLMARRIKAMGIKMVLSGEGADEIFGGYLYFHKAPSARDFHEETVRKLDQLHLYDCLRANKSMSAWGVEARVPFLDRDFLDHAMSIDPRHKMCGTRSDGNRRIEKHILRQAFEGYLPKDILWRQKEQFSDGVGYGWIDGLKKTAEDAVSNQMLSDATDRFPVAPPRTKEAYFYRAIFDQLFQHPSAAATVPYQDSVACSTATALEWDAAFSSMADPSGRAVGSVHQDAYEL